MGSKKPKGINDKVSPGEVTLSSSGVFSISTHRMQNISSAQKRDKENFFFSEADSLYFSQPKQGSKIHVVFNNQFKEYIQEIYDSKWNLIYLGKN